MIGIKDPGIILAYLLSVFSSVLCIVYGILNWNKGYIKEDDVEENIVWETEEDKINEEF